MKILTVPESKEHGPYWGETLYRGSQLYDNAPEGFYHPISFDDGEIIPDEESIIIVTCHRSHKNIRAVLYYDPVIGYFEPLMRGYWESMEFVQSKTYANMRIHLS